MAKEELLELEGVVTDVLPDARFRVKLDNDHQIVAYTAGKMKKHRIRTLVGDRVTVEMTPYDLDKGRIVFRHKDERAPATQGGRRRSYGSFGPHLREIGGRRVLDHEWAPSSASDTDPLSSANAGSKRSIGWRG